MNRCAIFIFFTVWIFLIAIVVIQHLRYRYLMKEKNYGIFHQIREQTRLARELERALIEKETLEKLVKSKLDESINKKH